MEKFRWGILSTANIGRKAMIPALQKSAMAEVTAVASRVDEKARVQELNTSFFESDDLVILDVPLRVAINIDQLFSNYLL